MSRSKFHKIWSTRVHCQLILILGTGASSHLSASQPARAKIVPFLTASQTDLSQTFPVISYQNPVSQLYLASRAGLFPIEPHRVAVIAQRGHRHYFPPPGSSDLDAPHETILQFLRSGEDHKESN